MCEAHREVPVSRRVRSNKTANIDAVLASVSGFNTQMPGERKIAEIRKSLPAKVEDVLPAPVEKGVVVDAKPSVEAKSLEHVVNEPTVADRRKLDVICGEYEQVKRQLENTYRQKFGKKKGGRGAESHFKQDACDKFARVLQLHNWNNRVPLIEKIDALKAELATLELSLPKFIY